NKTLMMTAGQYPPPTSQNSQNSQNSLNLKNLSISFINIQAFHLNIDINNSTASAGTNKISQILSSWSAVIDNIENEHLQIVNTGNGSISTIPKPDEQINDQCGLSSYAYWSWGTLSNLLKSSSCSTNLTTTSSSSWSYDFVNNAKQSCLYQQISSSTNYYVVFYEDYQSLSAKTDLIKNGRIAGIAISDITMSSIDPFINFIISGSQPNPIQGGVIVGSVLGSFVFVAVIAVAGFMLYRKRRAKMSDPLIDTNNQTCSDTNRQDYSDIKHQVRPDTHNRIYSDTNNE
ncbi:10798_t:CDS:2, partial [Dentiscutata erythropus]